MARDAGRVAREARERAVEPPARRFYQRVDRRKIELGWTDTELERQSGVNRSTYFRLNTNKRTPQPQTVQKLADAVGLDRTEAFLLAGLLHAETQTEPYPLPEVEADEETEELLAKLPPKRRAWLEMVLKDEQERMRQLHELAATEAARARKRFAELVRAHVDEDENDD